MQPELNTEIFKKKFVESFMEHIGINLPFVMDSNSGFVARIYPDETYFGRLNIHFEGAVYLTDSGQVHGLLVIYAHGHPLRNQEGWPVISCTADTFGKWSDCRLYIDEFDEYNEPQREPSNKNNEPIIPQKELTFKELLDFNFNTKFQVIEENENHFEAYLADGIGLKSIVHESTNNGIQVLSIRFKILGRNSLIGWSEELKFKRTEENNLVLLE